MCYRCLLFFGAAMAGVFATACDQKEPQAIPAASFDEAAGKSRSPVNSAQKGPDANRKGAGDARTVLPPGHPPIDGGAFPTSRPASGTRPPQPLNSTGGIVAPKEPETALKFDAPATWTAQPLASAMRRAQYVLPRATGDSEDGQLVVYYFGQGQGGTVESNLTRWKGQFAGPDGGPVPAEAQKTESFESHGLPVTVLDISGTFTDSMMGTPQPSGAKGQYRMLAAVVETPDGPWFFKATGPAATIAVQRDAIFTLLKSARR